MKKNICFIMIAAAAIMMTSCESKSGKKIRQAENTDSAPSALSQSESAWFPVDSVTATPMKAEKIESEGWPSERDVATVTIYFTDYAGRSMQVEYYIDAIIKEYGQTDEDVATWTAELDKYNVLTATETSRMYVVVSDEKVDGVLIKGKYLNEKIGYANLYEPDEFVQM